MDQQAKPSCSRNWDGSSSEPRKKHKELHSAFEEVSVANGCTDSGDKCISKLPHEMLVNIFTYLDFKTVSCCAMICKSFNEAAQDSMVHRHVKLKDTMSRACLDSYTRKVSHPKTLFVQYKHFGDEDYTEFNGYVTALINTQGQYLSALKVECCRSEEVFEVLDECSNLTSLTIDYCDRPVQKLSRLQNLTQLRLTGTGVEDSCLKDALKNNPNLKILLLNNNIRLNINSFVKTLGKYDTNIEEIYISFERCVPASTIKALACCHKLRTLKIINFPCKGDPEDSLQQLAIGCPLLKRLSVCGWRSINDGNLLPVLDGFRELTELELRDTRITIKTCREAAVSLPKLKVLGVFKCDRIKREELIALQQELQNIDIC